jgi:hypothetical protein
VHGGQHRLAAMGIRAVLEQVMVSKVGEQCRRPGLVSGVGEVSGSRIPFMSFPLFVSPIDKRQARARGKGLWIESQEPVTSLTSLTDSHQFV